jgi:nitroimidazol reductase NimA-like FMN-containing flavoprotein (pyridoxamine 5'-phosphate oxidase superfamily)
MEPLPEAVKQFVADARVCRIASVRPGGEPHVIPVCPVFDGDSTVYVDIGSRYTTAEALSADPRIAVLIDEYDDNWARLKGVLLRCRVEEATGEERERAWVMIREKFPAYKPIGWEPRLTLALRIYDWRQWGVTAPPRYEAE